MPGIISILERKTKIYEDSSHLSVRLCSPGGVCNHTANLAQKSTQMGHEVRIIALASKAVTVFGELKLSS